MSFNYNLLVALFLLVTTMSIVLLATWYFNRTIKGLIDWFFAYLSAWINIALFIWTPNFPEVAFMLVNTSTLIATGFLAFKACCRFMDVTFRFYRIAFLSIALVLLVSTYLTIIEPNQILRFFLSSATSGLFCIAGASLLVKGGFRNFPFQYLFSFTLFFHGLFNVFRFGLFTSTADAFIRSFSISSSDVIIFEQIVVSSLFPLLIVMMTNEVISKKLKISAEYDSLTNLFNRRIFFDLLAKSKSLAMRTKKPLHLLVLDVDHFKSINDEHGHLIGDQVLIDLAKKMKKYLRAEDVIGRIGGEEFAISLPDIDRESALMFAHRLTKIIASDPVVTIKGNIPYTISVGVALIDTEISVEKALDNADMAMYHAKRKGRNTVQYWNA